MQGAIVSECYVETVIDSSLCFPSKENNETSHEWVKRTKFLAYTHSTILAHGDHVAETINVLPRGITMNTNY